MKKIFLLIILITIVNFPQTVRQSQVRGLSDSLTKHSDTLWTKSTSHNARINKLIDSLKNHTITDDTMRANIYSTIGGRSVYGHTHAAYLQYVDTTYLLAGKLADKENSLTFSTGLSRATNTITVDTTFLVTQWDTTGRWQQVGSYVPSSRNLTAGNGINTIGDLSTDRTISTDTTFVVTKWDTTGRWAANGSYAAGTHTHTDTTYDTYTWTIAGELKTDTTTNYIIPFFIGKVGDQTVEAIKAKYMIHSGDSVKVTLYQNWTSKVVCTGTSAVKTTAYSNDFTDFALSDEDVIRLYVNTVGGTPKDMTFTLWIRRINISH